MTSNGERENKIVNYPSTFAFYFLPLNNINKHVDNHTAIVEFNLHYIIILS